MRVVEFTGDPCSGKSTLMALLFDSPLVVPFTKQLLCAELGIRCKSNSATLAVYEVYMLVWGLINLGPSLAWRFFKTSMSLNEPVLRRLNIYRNIVHKYGIHHFADNSSDHRSLLIDEGISHICYLFPGEIHRIDPDLLFQFPSDKPWILKLAVDVVTIARRLEDRGHKRLTGAADEAMAFALKNLECSEYQDKLLENYAKVVLRQSEMNTDIDHIRDLLYDCLLSEDELD